MIQEIFGLIKSLHPFCAVACGFFVQTLAAVGRLARTLVKMFWNPFRTLSVLTGLCVNQEEAENFYFTLSI